MSDKDLSSPSGNGSHSYITLEPSFGAPSDARLTITARDVARVIFRQRRLAVIAFLGTFVGAILIAELVIANRYQAQMEILVKQERRDPLVSPGPDGGAPLGSSIPEEVLNSEVELLQSQNLLEQVVVATGLDQNKGFWGRLLESSDPQIRRAKAVQRLGKKLDIEPVKKTNLIQVSYATSDPKLAAGVLRSLAELYLKKHVEVNRSPGTFNFFQQQATTYREKLGDAEARLASFSREHEAASPSLERDLTVQKLSEALANLRQMQANIAGSELRIRNLEAQLASTPERTTTQIHTADSAALIDQLKSVLLGLEIKRIDLLKKYSPTYPLVQEVDEQISHTRTSMEAAQKVHSHDQTTDRDATHEMLRLDLAKAKEELAALKASATVTESTIKNYRQTSVKLHGQALQQQDLEREAKADEASYLLYLRKQEDARTDDELDARRILNVSIAEAAAVPVLPWFPPALFAAIGGLLAVVVGLGSAFIADRLDPSFRTPDEVRELLDVPILASLSKNGHDVPMRVLTVGTDH